MVRAFLLCVAFAAICLSSQKCEAVGVLAGDPLPGKVAGDTIYFTGVGTSQFKVHWKAPSDTGDYNSATLGYDLEIAQLCPLDKSASLVSAGQVESHLYDDSGNDGKATVVSAAGVNAGTQLTPAAALAANRRAMGGIGGAGQDFGVFSQTARNSYLSHTSLPGFHQDTITSKMKIFTASGKFADWSATNANGWYVGEKARIVGPSAISTSAVTIQSTTYASRTFTTTGSFTEAGFAVGDVVIIGTHAGATSGCAALVSGTTEATVVIETLSATSMVVYATDLPTCGLGCPNEAVAGDCTVRRDLSAGCQAAGVTGSKDYAISAVSTPTSTSFALSGGSCPGANEICDDTQTPCSGASNLQACQDLCAADSTCVSFEFKAATSECQMSTSCMTATGAGRSDPDWVLYLKSAVVVDLTPDSGQPAASAQERAKTAINSQCTIDKPFHTAGYHYRSTSDPLAYSNTHWSRIEPSASPVKPGCNAGIQGGGSYDSYVSTCAMSSNFGAASYDTQFGVDTSGDMSGNTLGQGCGTASWGVDDPVDLTGLTTAQKKRHNYVRLTGVYTPLGGQDFSKNCEAQCEASTCTTVAGAHSVTSEAGVAAITSACGACYSKDAGKPGCYPGATGFPRAPHVCSQDGTYCEGSHVVTLPCSATDVTNGHCKGAYYAIRIRAYNQFGAGPWGEPSYAVQTHSAPTKPLGLAMHSTSQSVIDGNKFSKLPTEVKLTWQAPSNFGTGTDDCVDPTQYANAATALIAGKRSDIVAATTVKQLRCSMKSIADIKQDCASNAIQACVDSSNQNWPGFYDCGFANSEIVPYSCTTNGYGKSSFNTPSYAVSKVATDANGAKTYTQLVTGTSTSLTVTGLAAGTTYTFVARATKDDGTVGAYSDELVVKTPPVPDQPIAPPVVTDVTTTATETSISLDWVSALRTVTTKNPITGFKLYAQNFEGFVAPVTADCVAKNPHSTADVTTCNNIVALSTATACDNAAVCRYIRAQTGSAGSWQPAARSMEKSSDTSDFSDNDLAGSGTTAITIDGTSYTALELKTTTVLGSETVSPHGSQTTRVKVKYLRAATKYRFAIAFTNAAGTGAVSEWSAELFTLERPVSDLRILSGPPCVYETALSSGSTPTPTTFAAQAGGTDVKYRWELVYKADAGTGALNDAAGTRTVTFTADNTFAAIADEAWAVGQVVVIAKGTGSGLNCDAAGTHVVYSRSAVASASGLADIVLTPQTGTTILATVASGGAAQKNDDCVITAGAVAAEANRFGIDSPGPGTRAATFSAANTFVASCVPHNKYGFNKCEPWLPGQSITFALAPNGAQIAASAVVVASADYSERRFVTASNWKTAGYTAGDTITISSHGAATAGCSVLANSGQTALTTTVASVTATTLTVAAAGWPAGGTDEANSGDCKIERPALSCNAAGTHVVASLGGSTAPASGGNVVLVSHGTLTTTGNTGCVMTADAIYTDPIHYIKGVMSGSTIAGSGSSNCKNAECSVMEYAIPRPGTDDAVPNYDEIEIRVVAYNKRGMLRESVAFGWSGAEPHIHDINTIEYCGCTEPSDKNYWSIATYNKPDMCAIKQDWDSTATRAGHMLSVVNSGEFEYYQYHFDHTTHAVEITIRMDYGAVNVYLGTDGLATPGMGATYEVKSPAAGVVNFWHTVVPYRVLAGSSSLYITVEGRDRTIGADTSKFARYKVLAQAIKFRSAVCDPSSSTPHCTGANGIEGDGTDPQHIVFRNVLQNEQQVIGKIVSTYYYHFYEFYYPHADNDIDVEISVRVTGSNPVAANGAVTVFASTSERYPSPSRETDPSDNTALGQGLGYWQGSSHTGTVGEVESCVPRIWSQANEIACSLVTLGQTNTRSLCEAVGGTQATGFTCVYTQGSGTQTTPTPLKLMYTLRPQTHKGANAVQNHGGVIYVSVRGDAAHSPGQALPSSTYEIRAKVYRYRIESELLDLVGGLREDRRYSIVTLDNFNYYEVKLTPATYKVTVSIEVHYGEVDLYHSSTTLPTQDSNVGGTFGLKVVPGAKQTYTIISTQLNLVSGYVYVGLIGRTPDSAYDISVELHQVNGGNAATILYNCGSGIVSVNANCKDLSGAALTASDFGTQNSLPVKTVTHGSRVFTLADGAPTADLADPYKTLHDLSNGMSVTISSASGMTCSAAGTFTVSNVNGLAITVSETVTTEITGADCVLTFTGLLFPTIVQRDSTSATSNAKYYALHISEKPNVNMAVTQRSGTGSRVVDEDSGTAGLQTSVSQAAWGTDWTETSINTWIDDFSDELNLDVDVTVALPSAATVYMSAVDRWPSGERNTAALTTTASGQLDNVATFERTYVYLSIRVPSTASHTSLGNMASIRLTPRENVPAVASSVTAASSPSCPTATINGVATECGGQGSCVSVDSTTAVCYCNDGFFGSNCATQGMSGGADQPALAVLFKRKSKESSSNTAGIVCQDVTLALSGTLAAQAAAGLAVTQGAAAGVLQASAAQGAGVLTVTVVAGTFTAAGGVSVNSETHTATNVASVTACAIDDLQVTPDSTPTAGGKVSTLYTTATEAVTLDCSLDDCTPSPANYGSTKVGYVNCPSNPTICTKLVPAPMLTISTTIKDAPQYSKLMTYMDGKPYPRAGANTFVQTAACGGSTAGNCGASNDCACTSELKVYTMTPGVKHTVNFVLATATGAPLAIKTRSFIVSYQGGCGSGANDCGGRGVCHTGYCVCFDGYYGDSCQSTVDPSASSPSLASSFAAGAAYRLRKDALNLEKLAEARFVNKVHLEETKAELSQSKASLNSKKSSIRTKLNDEILKVDDPTTVGDENSVLRGKLASDAAKIATSVTSVFSKQERNAILIQQALQEAARLKTANHEAYLDHKRSLFEHQTAVQNRFDQARVAVGARKAAQQKKIDDAFSQGRFIKNQLRTANGPRTQVSDIKTKSCTNDQFFGTNCQEQQYDTSLFSAGAASDAIRTAAGLVDKEIERERCLTPLVNGECTDTDKASVPR
jgi:hypothetical protein